MNTSMQTNTDLYDAVLAQLAQRNDTPLPLATYLLRLLELAQACAQDRPMLPLEFAQLLEGAFDGTPKPLALAALQERASDAGNAAWLRTLAKQIVELREMEAAGTLEDEYRFFGLDAPSGARWYNFDPPSYIECGMTGSIGGWEESESSNRQLVPGSVAYIDSNGSMQTAKAEDLVQESVVLDSITWEDFEDFLWCGQNYE